MRVFVNTITHTYRHIRDLDNMRIDVETKNYVFTNSFRSQVSSIIEQKINSLSVDITSFTNRPINIFFDPNCDYPRYKLKDNKEVKRVIKIEKSDVAIVTNKFSKVWSRRMSDRKIFFYNGELHDLPHSFLNTFSINEILKIDASIEVEEICYNERYEYSEKTTKFLYNLFNTYTKIMTNIQLDTLINASLMKMSDDDYTSIKTMLQSSDDDTFKLGLKMLIGYDTNKNACRIGSLIIECCWSRSFQLTDVCTTQILTTLDIKKGEQADSDKSYLSKLMSKSTDEEDILFGRTKIVENLKENLLQRARWSLENFPGLDISVNVDVI